MTNTLPLQRSVRRIVPIAIIVVGLILISVLLIQQVSAQESRTLKPPFKLIQSDRTAQHPDGHSAAVGCARSSCRKHSTAAISR